MSRHLLPPGVFVALAGLMLLHCLACCHAQPGGTDPGPLPVAGPPPTDDALPPLPEEARRSAGLQMLIVVVVGLAVVIGLLHFVKKGRVKAPPQPSPEQDLVRRAQEALERMDSRRPAGNGTDERIE